MIPHIANILTTKLRRTVLKKPFPPFLNALYSIALPVRVFTKLISHPRNAGKAYWLKLKANIIMNKTTREDMPVIIKFLMNFLKSSEFSIGYILDFLFYLPV